MPCTRFDAPCFQLVQQSYTKSELLFTMRLLESNIAKHGRKIYAPIFKGKYFIGQTVTNPWPDWLVLMASWFSIKISLMRSLFGFDAGKNMVERTHVCNLEIRIEETSNICEKRGQLLKKMSKYQNIKLANNSSIKWESWNCWLLCGSKKSHGCIVSTFVLYFQFEIFCRSWFKFLIGNFTVVMTKIFFPDWESEFLKQLDPNRYFSGNWWNWCKNESALGIKYLHRRNFFSWVKIR